MRFVPSVVVLSFVAACASTDQQSPSGDLLEGIEMKVVEAGSFEMGSAESDAERGTDEMLHEVSLSQDFELGLTEVTVDQFRAYMNYDSVE